MYRRYSYKWIKIMNFKAEWKVLKSGKFNMIN